MASEFLTCGSAPIPNVSKEVLDKILRRHVWGAAGVGVIPVPVVDLAALTGIQLNLLRKLGNLYNMTLAEQGVTKIISSLLSSVMPTALGPSLALSLSKIVPLLGPNLGAVTMPLMFGASTYALGKVFIQHFESGGTFLSFDPDKVKAYYAAMFQEGKAFAAKVQTEQPIDQTEEPVEQPERPTEQIAPPDSVEQEEQPATPELQAFSTKEPSSGPPEEQKMEEAREAQNSKASEAQEPDTFSKKERRRKSSQTK